MAPACLRWREPGRGIRAASNSHSGEGTLIDNLARPARAVCLAALVLASFTSSAAAATRLVDDDKAECPNADFTKIKDAAAQATANDEIVVCPGLYQEAGIVVTGPLTLRGAGADL